MSKQQWTGSVWVNAPLDEVYGYLADFTRHPEWDDATVRVEQTAPGDATGVGAEYKAYESLGKVAKVGSGDSFIKDQAGLAKREVREMILNRRLAWHTHPVPNIGVSADCAFNLSAENDGTTVTQTVEVSTLPGLHAITSFVFRSLDAKQQASWAANLDRLKTAVEHAHATALVPAGH